MAVSTDNKVEIRITGAVDPSLGASAKVARAAAGRA